MIDDKKPIPKELMEQAVAARKLGYAPKKRVELLDKVAANTRQLRMVTPGHLVGGKQVQVAQRHRHQAPERTAHGPRSLQASAEGRRRAEAGDQTALAIHAVGAQLADKLHHRP